MCAAADMWNYFFPAIMAVGMSCLGFFVRADAMPARAAIGIISMLISLTNIIALNTSLPPGGGAHTSTDQLPWLSSFVLGSFIWTGAALTILVFASFGQESALWLQRQQNKMKGRKTWTQALLARPEALIELLDEWDEDHDSQVTKLEFRRGIAALGLRAKATEVNDLFDLFDRDGDGVIEMSELQAHLAGASVMATSNGKGCRSHARAPSQTSSRIGRQASGLVSSSAAADVASSAAPPSDASPAAGTASSHDDGAPAAKAAARDASAQGAASKAQLRVVQPSVRGAAFESQHQWLSVQLDSAQHADDASDPADDHQLDGETADEALDDCEAGLPPPTVTSPTTGNRAQAGLAGFLVENTVAIPKRSSVAFAKAARAVRSFVEVDGTERTIRSVSPTLAGSPPPAKRLRRQTSQLRLAIRREAREDLGKGWVWSCQTFKLGPCLARLRFLDTPARALFPLGCECRVPRAPLPSRSPTNLRIG